MTNEIVKFSFDGGLSDEHQLNAYEFGRFMAASSRLILHTEHFRQTGSLMSRVNRRVNLDLRIGVPKDGSFLQEIVLFGLPILKETFISAPFSVLFSYFISRIFDLGGSKTEAEKIAKKAFKEIGKANKRQFLLSLKQQENYDKFLDTINKKDAQISDLIKALEFASSKKFEVVPYISSSRETIESALSRAKLFRENDNRFKEYEEELSQIDQDSHNHLDDLFQRNLGEIGYPLGKSSKKLSIIANENEKIISVQEDDILNLKDVIQDEEADDYDVNILNYDKETGYGKMRVEKQEKPVPFLVSRALLVDHRDKILDAMKENSTTATLLATRKKNGDIIRFLYIDI